VLAPANALVPSPDKPSAVPELDEGNSLSPVIVNHRPGSRSGDRDQSCCPILVSVPVFMTDPPVGSSHRKPISCCESLSRTRGAATTT